MPKVALVIGHGIQTDGSWDCGTTWNGDTEAQLMKPIVGEAVAILREKGVAVYTDYPENDFNIIAGTGGANAWGADIYVSLHCDYCEAPSGTLPIIYPGSSSGAKLANALNSQVTKRMGIGTRGILQRDDMEVSRTSMPACIFETGCISRDNAILKRSKEYGQAVAYGILDYFNMEYTSAASPSPQSSGTAILLERGDEGEAVRQLQRDLSVCGYGPLVQDGDFGPATETAVREMQRYHGLDPDGIYGPLSDAALMGEVREIQKLLVKKGYTHLEVDGAAGEETIRCIHDVQYRNGLAVDGIVGQKTMAVLKN